MVELMMVFLLRHNRAGTSSPAGALGVMLADDKPIILALPGRYGPKAYAMRVDASDAN